MSIEKTVCNLTKTHWKELGNDSPPSSPIFIKIAGKTSPNASIIAMILDAQTKKPIAITKIPRNPKSITGIKREYEAMLDIKNNIMDSKILSHIPYRGLLAQKNNTIFLLQEAADGHPMVREITTRRSVEILYAKILPWMYNLHIDGSKEQIINGDILENLIKKPISLFLKQFEKTFSQIISDSTLKYLHQLPNKVLGKKINLCRQHGDFNAHNTIINNTANTLHGFTVIDWEDYLPSQLPVHDLNHFFTSNSHLLGEKMPPEESYKKIVLQKGWYNSLFSESILHYEKQGIIDREVFFQLTPLYFINMCLRVNEAHRAQQHTTSTWIKRMNVFIKHIGAIK